jgi:hypothetical protein
LARRLIVASDGTRPGRIRVADQFRLPQAQGTGRPWVAAQSSTAAMRRGWYWTHFCSNRLATLLSRV